MKNSIYNRLKEEIITSQYYPGEVIEEKALAAKYNVSRTPIREVLGRLRQEKWVESISGKGLRISRITLKQIKDLFQLRYELEPLMLNLSYRFILEENLMMIKRQIEHSLKFEDIEKLTKLDDELHYEIFANCKNDLAIDIMKNIQELTRRLRYFTHTDKETTIKSAKEHILLIEAIQDRDYERSSQVLRQHIDNKQLYIMRNINL